MSSTPTPVTLAVSYTTEVFSPPNIGPITAITATVTGSASGNTAPLNLSIPIAATSVSASLIPDTYTWTLNNEDAAGNTYGGPFTGSFTVSAPATVTLSLANGLALS